MKQFYINMHRIFITRALVELGAPIPFNMHNSEFALTISKTPTKLKSPQGITAPGTYKECINYLTLNSAATNGLSKPWFSL